MREQRMGLGLKEVETNWKIKRASKMIAFRGLGKRGGGEGSGGVERGVLEGGGEG
jgi:hypothetical protein